MIIVTDGEATGVGEGTNVSFVFLPFVANKNITIIITTRTEAEIAKFFIQTQSILYRLYLSMIKRYNQTGNFVR